MSERITGLEHLGMGQNCFTWRIAPVVKEGPTDKELKYEKFKERQKIYQREYRRMQKAAMRVNPESNICKSPITNSQRAAR
jgi:predicted phosphohydrolase